MGFDKKAYRKRREQGFRGQGPKFVDREMVEEGKGGHGMMGPKGIVFVNRKQSRQHLRTRHFDADRMMVIGRERQHIEYDDDGEIVSRKLGKPIKRKVKDEQGRPYTRPHVTHKEGEPKFNAHKKDNPRFAGVGNHERVFRSRLNRQRSKSKQGE